MYFDKNQEPRLYSVLNIFEMQMNLVNFEWAKSFNQYLNKFKQFLYLNSFIRNYDSPYVS